jgi:hypothetical protein
MSVTKTKYRNSINTWKGAWQDVDIFNKNLIEDPTKQVPRVDLSRVQIKSLQNRPWQMQ